MKHTKQQFSKASSQIDTTPMTAEERKASAKQADEQARKWLQMDVARSKALAKERLLHSIKTMREFLDDAEREINRDRDSICSLAQYVTKQVAWGYANASGDLNSAAKYGEEAVKLQQALDQRELAQLELEKQESKSAAGLNALKTFVQLVEDDKILVKAEHRQALIDALSDANQAISEAAGEQTQTLKDACAKHSAYLLGERS